MSGSDRIGRCFDNLARQRRAGLVTFVTAGDPDYETSLATLKGLPQAGADIIELGMPFTDPMADGPAIQAASLRALANGHRMDATFALARAFRRENATTPLILMGYFNPVYRYGRDRFLDQARQAGIDGLIIVDLPPEEDEALCLPAIGAGLSFIRLATPTTTDERLTTVLRNASGFLYYVSVLGITGTKDPDIAAVGQAVSRLKRSTSLPVAVGFGVKTAAQAAAVVAHADAVVVGSCLVDAVREALDGGAEPACVPEAVLARVRRIAQGVKSVAKARD